MRTRLIATVMLLSLGIALPAWAGAQGKGQCQFPGDGVNGPILRYRTQHNGTITDLNTGLMWEMKDTGNGIHGVNRTFTWSIGQEIAPHGTAFTVFLDTLNTRCDGDETRKICTKNADCKGIGTGMCGYAGHRDWRMPNVKELQSIVDYGVFQPAIDPVFGPTARNFYWSFTTFVNAPGEAAIVDFEEAGATVLLLKGNTLPVRAVRDSQCQ
jgi:hypothetical protein